MTRLLVSLASAAAFAFAPSAESAPKCPAGMTPTADGKGCATDGKAAASPAGSFDVLGNIMDTSKKEINAKQAVATSKEDLLKSDFHKKYMEGHWDFFQSSSKAKPGEYCTALFLRQEMAVAIMGPGGDYRGALMLFMPLTESQVFPKSKEARVIKVTLGQAKDPDVTVGVFNFSIGAWEAPAIAFAVPTIEAALAGMEEKLDFRLDYEGKRIGEIEWHSGVAARESLKACLAGRK